MKVRIARARMAKNVASTGCCTMTVLLPGSTMNEVRVLVVFKIYIVYKLQCTYATIYQYARTEIAGVVRPNGCFGVFIFVVGLLYPRGVGVGGGWGTLFTRFLRP